MIVVVLARVCAYVWVLFCDWQMGGLSFTYLNLLVFLELFCEGGWSKLWPIPSSGFIFVTLNIQPKTSDSVFEIETAESKWAEKETWKQHKAPLQSTKLKPSSLLCSLNVFAFPAGRTRPRSQRCENENAPLKLWGTAVWEPAGETACMHLHEAPTAWWDKSGITKADLKGLEGPTETEDRRISC